VYANLFEMFSLGKVGMVGLMATPCQMVVQTTYHGATKMSPSEVVYGRKKKTISALTLTNHIEGSGGGQNPQQTC